MKHEASGFMRWLLTYTDMVTLLLALFIMLYAFSKVDEGKFKEVAAAMRKVFGGQPVMTGGTGPLGEGAGIKVAEAIMPGVESLEPSLAKLYEEVKGFVEGKGLGGKVQLKIEERGVKISLLTDEALFERGKAELRPENEELLLKISSQIKKSPNQVRIEGHTCNLPIKTAEFPSNWELSTRRATNVLRYLVEQGNVPPNRLSAAGYGETRPVAKNIDEAHRRQNRRVDIIILTSKEAKLEPE